GQADEQRASAQEDSVDTPSGHGGNSLERAVVLAQLILPRACVQYFCSLNTTAISVFVRGQKHKVTQAARLDCTEVARVHSKQALDFQALRRRGAGCIGESNGQTTILDHEFSAAGPVFGGGNYQCEGAGFDALDEVH